MASSTARESDGTCSAQKLTDETIRLFVAVKVCETELQEKPLAAGEADRIRLKILQVREDYHIAQKTCLEAYWQEQQIGHDDRSRQRYQKTMDFHQAQASRWRRRRSAIGRRTAAS